MAFKSNQELDVSPRTSSGGRHQHVTALSNRGARAILYNFHVQHPRLRRGHRHQPLARRGGPLHQHAVTIFIGFTPQRGHRLHRHATIRLHRHGVAIFINSSYGEGVIYIDADGCPHDVVIFFDLLPGKDTDSTGTPPFFYTERRSSP